MKERCAWIFPGQGAQYPGMGKDFVKNFAVARHIFEEADDILSRNLSSIILEGSEAVLKETANSQVAIYVVSIAILRVLEQEVPHVAPVACAGLSLGEYSALTAAGYLNFATCLPLVQKRGEFMNAACEKTPGTMAVILGLSAADVEGLVREINLPNDLWAANFNCPGQVVISGTLKGIEAGKRAAGAKGARRVLPLNVQGAFHSGLMVEAQEQLRPYLEDMEFHKSAIPIVMNVSGKKTTDPEQIRQQLIQQVTEPVRWEQGIREMESLGVEQYIEIGCGKILAGFNKRSQVLGSTHSIETVQDLEEID